MLRLNRFPTSIICFKELECTSTRKLIRCCSNSPQTFDGKNAIAVILGGFGSRERQMKRHSALYNKHNFNVMPVMSGMLELTTPEVASARGKTLALKLQAANVPIVVHTISASFWTVIYMLEHLDKSWKEENVKAIVFDSCPAMSDLEAFEGWLTVRLEQTSLNSFLAPLFQPFLSFCGVTDDWRKENHKKMFGEDSVIPRNANILVIYGKDDPVLNRMYISSFVEDLQKHKSPEASVTEKQFDNSIHAMSIREHKEEYQEFHANNVLAKVPDWST